MYVCLKDQTLTRNNYKCKIQASLKSHCTILYLYSICNFMPKNSVLKAREKMSTNFNACSSTCISEVLTGLMLLSYFKVILGITEAS